MPSTTRIDLGDPPGHPVRTGGRGRVLGDRVGGCGLGRGRSAGAASAVVASAGAASAVVVSRFAVESLRLTPTSIFSGAIRRPSR
jgi:hypothetical protein